MASDCERNKFSARARKSCAPLTKTDSWLKTNEGSFSDEEVRSLSLSLFAFFSSSLCAFRLAQVTDEVGAVAICQVRFLYVIRCLMIIARFEFKRRENRPTLWAPSVP